MPHGLRASSDNNRDVRFPCPGPLTPARLPGAYKFPPFLAILFFRRCFCGFKGHQPFLPVTATRISCFS